MDIVKERQRKIDPNEKNRNIVKIPRERQPRAVVDSSAELKSRWSWFCEIASQIARKSVLWIIGLALGGVGMWWNVQYWYAFGGIAFGILGGAIDGVTVFLPLNLRWRLSHSPLYALWLLCAVLSAVAELGSSANRIGDSLQGLLRWFRVYGLGVRSQMTAIPKFLKSRSRLSADESRLKILNLQKIVLMSRNRDLYAQNLINCVLRSELLSRESDSIEIFGKLAGSSQPYPRSLAKILEQNISAISRRAA